MSKESLQKKIKLIKDKMNENELLKGKIEAVMEELKNTIEGVKKNPNAEGRKLTFEEKVAQHRAKPDADYAASLQEFRDQEDAKEAAIEGEIAKQSAIIEAQYAARHDVEAIKATYEKIEAECLAEAGAYYQAKEQERLEVEARITQHQKDWKEKGIANFKVRTDGIKSFADYIDGDTLNCSGVTNLLDMDLEELLSFLNTGHIKHLNFSNCNINFVTLHQSHYKDLLDTITFPYLESIDLSGNKFTKPHFYIRGIKYSASMKSINLSNGEIKFDVATGVVIIERIAQLYPNLEYLNFSNTKMHDGFITQYLCKNIKDGLLSKCKTLDISGNPLTLNAIKQLIQTIKESNCPLTTLKVVNDSITPDQEEALTNLLHGIDTELGQNTNEDALDQQDMDISNSSNDDKAKKQHSKDILDADRIETIETLATIINGDNYRLIKSMLETHEVNDEQSQYLVSSFSHIKDFIPAGENQSYLAGLIEMLTHPETLS